MVLQDKNSNIPNHDNIKNYIPEQYQKEYCLLFGSTILEHSTDLAFIIKRKQEIYEMGILTILYFPTN